MTHVLEDLDLLTHVCKSLCIDYQWVASGASIRGASRPSPEHRTAELRQLLRIALKAMGMAGRVSTFWNKVSRLAFEELLGIVARQFASMQVETLDWLRKQPRLYDQGNIHPPVPATEAVRVFGNSMQGQVVLEPLRVCYEVPVVMKRNKGLLPLCNLNKPFPPYRENFDHWSPQHLARHVRTAGHWLRTWTSELTWVDAPTFNPEALWLATNRGCAVCGTQCKLQGGRVDLFHGEYYNTNDIGEVMSMKDRADGPQKSPFVGMNAYIEVPWDLVPVNERLVDETPHHIVAALATRVLPYTHRAHMVTLFFCTRTSTNMPTADPKYSIRYHTPIGVDESKYEHTEEEIMLQSVMSGLHRTSGWNRSTFVSDMFQRRFKAIHDSGLHGYMQTKKLDADYIKSVCYPHRFRATLPLLPMHGQPEAHSWSAVLGISKEYFYQLVWTEGVRLHPPLVTFGSQVESWRKQTARRMIAMLSERLPRSDMSVFYRKESFFGGVAAADYVPRLTDTYASRILNLVEHGDFQSQQMFGHEHIMRNHLLLSTWPDLRDLMVPTAESRTRDLASILNQQSRFDPTDEAMVKHFQRLDTLLGPAWRVVEETRFSDECIVDIQAVLINIFQSYIEAVPDLEPAPMEMRYGRILPGAPRHPDVWLRWVLRAFVKPDMHQIGIDEGSGHDWEYLIQVDRHNTFLIDANEQQRRHVELRNMGVHVSYYVRREKFENERVRPVFTRLAVGIRLSSLMAIHRGVMQSRVELDRQHTQQNRAPISLTATQPPLVDLFEKKHFYDWHKDALDLCKELQNVVRHSNVLALDLLRRLLDTEWTPVHDKCPTWCIGWEALRDHCGVGQEWFESTARVRSFCATRNLTYCMCSERCVI